MPPSADLQSLQSLHRAGMGKVHCARETTMKKISDMTSKRVQGSLSTTGSIRKGLATDSIIGT
jgi:Ni,Fe-hydrogenase III large subunit